MKRRTALKKLGLLTGGLLLFPACDYSDDKAAIILNNLQVTKAQEQLLIKVVDTFIPETDIPGAVQLGVHNFVWIMADDMLSPKRKQSFLKHLENFEHKVKADFGKSLTDLSLQSREKALNEIKGVSAFTGTVKSYTILGYMQSEYIMTKIMPYALVPGNFGNCELVESGKRINIYG